MVNMPLTHLKAVHHLLGKWSQGFFLRRSPYRTYHEIKFELISVILVVSKIYIRCVSNTSVLELQFHSAQ